MVSFLPKESFKASSIRTAISAISKAGKGSRTLSNHQKLVGTYLSIPTTKKCSSRSFCNYFFPVAPKMVQVWEEKAPE